MLYTVNIKKTGVIALDTNYIAHIKTNNDDHPVIQPCYLHLKNCATYAANALKDSGLYNSGFFAGVHHDIGKMKQQFTDYIISSYKGSKASKGSVIHTFAGVRHILEKYWKDIPLSDTLDYNTTSEILAYSVGAHHSLFDCINEAHESGFTHRIDTIVDGDRDAIHKFTDLCAEKNLDLLFEKATKEISAFEMNCISLCKNKEDEVDESEFFFMLGMITRLITSAVIDGDRRDTAEFMMGVTFPQDASSTLWTELLERVENKLNSLDCSTEINKMRRMISDKCRCVAEESPGIYRLNVPTGGGKTLSSLRYALAHASRFNKKRIIFTSPLLSILDQNSKIIRDYLEDDSIILEHHSNIVRTNDITNEEDQYKLLCESWSSPVIITTLVQLLNTMFDGKSSSVRRFHTLTNSVIIIDEVQTIPPKLLTMFNLAISFLAHCCGATIVLCSATQPYLEKIPHSVKTEIKDIMCDFEPSKFKVFKRTNIEFSGSYRLDEIPGFAFNVLDKTNSLLIVCNKRNQADQVFRAMQCDDYNVFYISASLCSEHRKKTLSEIYTSLQNKKRKTICVSTQVIEAGVDISFGSVIRFEAGLDNIVQSAGRCNRNGEMKEISPVYIVRVIDEDLSYLSEIKDAKLAMQQLLVAYSSAHEPFDNDLSSCKASKYYYEKLYNEKNFDYSLGKGRATLYDMLSCNLGMDSSDGKPIHNYTLRQAFATAGKLFNVFDTDTIDVIVPYGEGEDIINGLLSERAKYDYIYTKDLLNKAKHYSVSLHMYAAKQADKAKALIPLANEIAFAVNKSFYDNQTGISTNFETEAKKCNILIL